MRLLFSGLHLKVRAPALELSFPIPAGVSGGPVFVERSGSQSFTSGLCGVCLANIQTTSVLYELQEEDSSEGRTIIREQRVIEYGIAASLVPLGDQPIPMVGKSLYTLVGRGSGRAVVGPRAATPNQ